ncbi:MAG TPA: SidA/IucD/PvdA family monooxygenase [Gemmataceae bacterium]|jgi:mycobactin lysine-N-oxygenase|nr:SidA/IucD/PvdA family monooxygenase [Gemmataceae bacterium]
MDGKTFWKKLSEIKEQLPRKNTFVVVGTGETAAAVIVALLPILREERNASISVISRRGYLSSRGESYVENAVFTGSPHVNWQNLPIESRREFILRTDRSVFSVGAMQQIGAAQGRQLDIVMGDVRGYRYTPQTREWSVEYRDSLTKTIKTARSAYVIDTRSFNTYGFLDWMDDRSRMALLEVAQRSPGRQPKSNDQNILQWLEKNLEFCIDRDLSVSGLTPKLHLPMLSAIQQGPGLPNLSCLGSLADRILRPYVPI